MKRFEKKIIDLKLIKFEKLFNQAEKEKYYYNIELEGIDDLLLVESHTPIPSTIIGKKIKYKLNSENEVSDFDFV